MRCPGTRARSRVGGRRSRSRRPAHAGRRGRDRYESLSIANDVVLGIWFTVGSFLFFSESTMTEATVLFVLGSMQMLIGPVIRVSRRIHLRRRGYVEGGTQQDF